MKKIISIAWKDLTLAFRDRAAIIMLAAPFVLTVAMGFVTGSFSKNGSGLEPIPLLVINHDEGEIGANLSTWLQSVELQDLLATQIAEDEVSARQLVNDGRVSALVIIPSGFSSSILTGERSTASLIELFTNPGEPIRASILHAALDRYLSEIETSVVSAQVAVAGLLASGILAPQDVPAAIQEIGSRPDEAQSPLGVLIDNQQRQSPETGFDPLAVLAPGMAMIFLMYTVTNVGGRSILAEREAGTLARMLTTPSSSVQVLGGKLLGILWVGIAQMGILISASSLFFGLDWGRPLPVALLIVAAVIGAAGWGLLVAASTRTAGQVSSIGTALMLLFGLLGGSFTGGFEFPGITGILSKITPNAWAQQGFIALATGGSLDTIAAPLSALLIMGSGLFVLAVIVFRRRGLGLA